MAVSNPAVDVNSLADYLSPYHRERTLRAEHPYGSETLSVYRKLSQERWEREEKEYIVRSAMHSLTHDLAERLFEIVLNKGVFGIDIFTEMYIEPEHYYSTMVIAMHAKFSKADKVTMRYVEVAEPRVDLVPQLVAANSSVKKRVFFCAGCGTPYFWGERTCKQCGLPHDYSKSKEFNNDF